MQIVQNCFNEVVISIEKRKLQPAFQALEKLINQLNNCWQLKEQFELSKRTYKTMLFYWTENSQDTEREKIYQTLLCSLYAIADIAILEINSSNSNSLFYEKKRFYFSNNSTESAENLLSYYKEINSKISSFSLNQKKEKKIFVKEKENIYQKIFHKIWLSNHWTSQEKNQWIIIVHSPKNKTLSCLIISAITLNLLEIFDEEKINVLIEASRNNQYNEIHERALIGLVLILRKYNYRIHLYKKIAKQVQELTENPIISKKVCQILLQFIVCKNTEKITKKITNELIPEIIQKVENKNSVSKIVDISILNNELEEKNPEWYHLIDSSNIEEKLKEISEWQIKGEDVMYASFFSLKNYSFFKEISHWFIPFTIPSETIGNLELTALVKLLKSSSLLCNSDKYSFYLNVSQMPETSRKKIIKQFFSESVAIKEIKQEDINSFSQSISSSIKQYIQDLYRFYKLYPKKQEFEDIFNIKPELYQVSWIYKFIKEKQNLSTIGEYYFNINCFNEAIYIYKKLLQFNQKNDLLYQKIGFCFQMTNQFQTALEAYQKAELFNSTHSWTIKKIAHIYRILKNPKEALYYYKKAEQLTPDDLIISLNIGHCYSELKAYDQALKYYFKVEYLTTKKEKVWRLIGWCSLLIGNYLQASCYFNKVIEEQQPVVNDYINYGHIKWMTGNTKEAIGLYKMAIKKGNCSYKDFSTLLYDDISVLSKAGISKETIYFMVDSCYLL